MKKENSQPHKQTAAKSSRPPLKKTKTLSMGGHGIVRPSSPSKEKVESSPAFDRKKPLDIVENKGPSQSSLNTKGPRSKKEKKNETKRKPVGQRSKVPTLRPPNTTDNKTPPSKKPNNEVLSSKKASAPAKKEAFRVKPPPPPSQEADKDELTLPPIKASSTVDHPPPDNSSHESNSSVSAVDVPQKTESTQEYQDGKWSTSLQKKDKKNNRKNLGRFEFLIEMAQGGMATLYLARLRGPQKFEKLLAIKKIHDHLASQTKFVEMFMDEARIAALIHHPSVATIFDMGKVDNSYFIAMEYVHGESLNELIKTCLRQKHLLPWQYAVWLVNEATNGLDAAHKLTSPEGNPLDVVHRDVTPHNILVSYEGHVKVVDFGIAYAKERLTQTAHDVIKGKVAYMSPEQTDGQESDRRSDIFSLGIVLFEAVCMRRLFKERTQAATIKRISEGTIPKPRKIRSDVPAELERIILKALAHKPENRYQTAGELSDDLENLLASQGEAVNSRKIAGLMGRLFHDRKRIKDQQIKVALDSVSNVALKDVVGIHTNGLSEPSIRQAVASGISRKTKIAISLAAAATITVLLVTAFFKIFGSEDAHEKEFFLSNSLELNTSAQAADRRETRENRTSSVDSTKTDKTQNSEKKTKDEETKTATITIDVIPSDAEAVFTFRGTKHQGSPLRLTVPVSEKPETIVVQAAGFLSQPVIVVPSSNTKFQVELHPAANADSKSVDKTGQKTGRKSRRRRRRSSKRKKKKKRSLLRGIDD